MSYLEDESRRTLVGRALLERARTSTFCSWYLTVKETAVRRLSSL